MTIWAYRLDRVSIRNDQAIFEVTLIADGVNVFGGREASVPLSAVQGASEVVVQQILGAQAATMAAAEAPEYELRRQVASLVNVEVPVAVGVE